METPATGTSGPSPTALPPTATATAPQIIARQVVPTAVIAVATAAPSAVPVPVSVQSAPIPASIAAPSVSSSSSTSSSSSSGPPPAAVGLPPPPPPGYAASVGNTPNSVGGAPGSAFPSAFGTPVVSAVRGNVVVAGAPSALFPGAPAAVRPAVPPGYAVGPTGTAVPVINPRAGHPRQASSAEGALLLGIIFMVVGAGLRRCAVTGGAAFARDVRTRYTTSALLRSVRNAREG
ncbi:MAG: hypothetical protein LC748_08270 [Thermomicrobia bacterium]|nr:hypothetical protein [Thermomicrobia bacterium]